ncbi:hypothetical protein IFM89_014235 [Coptis chinensis]|uniref:Uncharacterized protein n=1 Tax=Coptis chinensis TaxID=261450 RepID=A0A835LH59_9MAGN|nr:hypothetical protein IFM89_014235 [Coptis chinensis]
MDFNRSFMFKEKKIVQPTFSAERIFGGTLLAMCSNDLGQYGTQQRLKQVAEGAKVVGVSRIIGLCFFQNDHDPSKLVAETPCKLLHFLVLDVVFLLVSSRNEFENVQENNEVGSQYFIPSKEESLLDDTKYKSQTR